MSSPSADRVRAIVTKEWLDLRRNKTVLGAFIALPVLLTAVSSVMMLTAAKALAKAEPKPSTMKSIPAHIAALTSDPREATLMMMVFTGLMMFSMVPVLLPSIMAAHSIVGEKQARSLEPLLATPIRTWELLVGKLVAIVIPALIPSLLGFSVYVAVVASIAPPAVFHLVVSPGFLLTVGLVGPLAAVLSVTFGLMVSSRSADLQSAQGISGLLVLPVIGLGMGQLFGAVSVTVLGVLARALGLLVVDAGLVLLCISVFERETILARWK